MICGFPKWWSFLTYDGFKSHLNITYAIGFSSEERIKVGKEEAGTSNFDQAYDKFQAKQEKAQTRQILELTQQKVHGRLNQWKLIMIVSTFIQNIPDKFWTDSVVDVNRRPHHCLSFYGWIKKIVPAVKRGETEYFRNHKGSYYDAMSYVWKKMTVIKRR